jgi:hypothetical protein
MLISFIRVIEPEQERREMATGACGINCDVCKLNHLKICTTCGDGLSNEGGIKAEIQINLFGRACPILECARLNHIRYCMGDCDAFPCENFKNGPYPYGPGFLAMQERRRKELRENPLEDTLTFTVSPGYWEKVKEKDLKTLCEHALVLPYQGRGFQIRFLNEDILVDTEEKTLFRITPEKLIKIEAPVKELLILIYLINASTIPFSRKMVGIEQLKNAHFFQGPHAIRKDHILDRFGNDLKGFMEAGNRIDGKPINMADVAFMFFPLPKVPVYYLLWQGDNEFPPRISILFDHSIENYFPADAIWGLVHVVSRALLEKEPPRNDHSSS